MIIASVGADARTDNKGVTRPIRADIQQLRGVAVLIVVLFHAKIAVFSQGYLGVDIFFVISGFLITGLISRELEQGRFSLGNFYFRRAKRLLPALYVVLAAVSTSAPFILNNAELADYTTQVLGSIAYFG